LNDKRPGAMIVAAAFPLTEAYPMDDLAPTDSVIAAPEARFESLAPRRV
jgi:hypothetical protein